MTKQKNTCDCKQSLTKQIVDSFNFCPMCGKPLKEKEWEPEVGKPHYWIEASGGIACNHLIDYQIITTEFLKKLHAAGNLFTTREAAEKHLAMIKCVDSQRELPYSTQDILQITYNGDIFHCQFNRDALSVLLWRLGFAQPDTPEGRALLEKNIREHKEWFK